MPVHHRQIDPLGLAPLELLAQQPLRARILREDDQPGRVAIDAVHDERPAFAAAQVFRQQFVDRRRILSPLERHRQQARRLIDDHQYIVFVDDLEVLGAANRARRSSCVSRCRGDPSTRGRCRLPTAARRPEPASPRRR